MAGARPAPLLRSTGGIPQSHLVLGVVYGYSLRTAEGCNNRVPILEAFRDATDMLDASARSSGGDAVIHIGYLQRDASTLSCGQSKPATEVYAWGTVVKLNG